MMELKVLCIVLVIALIIGGIGSALNWWKSRY
jgi:hypothetical protein